MKLGDPLRASRRSTATPFTPAAFIASSVFTPMASQASEGTQLPAEAPARMASSILYSASGEGSVFGSLGEEPEWKLLR